MKLLKITIENLNSIDKAEIDFRSEILSREPLFLICGDTGTGKTTLLDAITLALYDKASRFESTDNKEKSSDGQTAQSTTHILRRGTTDGFAKVLFQVQESVYEAIWQMHKTRNGSFDTNNRRRLNLIIDGNTLELRTKVNEVNEKINALIGLTYEQFMRSVMLAQGHFSTFITSEKSKQAEILEMLTGTEIYSKIADEIRSRKNAADAVKKDLKSKYDEVSQSGMSEEQVEALQKEKDALDKEIEKKDKDLKRIDRQIQWLTERERIQKEQDTARNQFTSALYVQNADETQQKRKIVHDYQATESIRKSLTDKMRIEADLKERTQKLDEDRIRFADLMASREKMSQQKQDLIDKRKTLQVYLEQEDSKKEMFGKAAVIQLTLKDAEKAQKAQSDYEKEVVQATQEKELAEKRIEQETLQYDGICRQAETAKEALAVARTDFENTHQEALQKGISEKQAEQNRWLRYEQKLHLIQDDLNHYQSCQSQITTMQSELLTLQPQITEKNLVRDQAQEAYEQAKIVYQRQHTTLEDVVKAYRAQLVDGEPCPVCGSTKHLFKSDEALTALLKEYETSLKEAETAMNKAKDALNTLSAEIQVKTKAVQQKEKEGAELAQKILGECQREELPMQQEMDEKFRDCKTHLDDLGKTIAALQQKNNAANQLRNLLDQRQKESSTADQKAQDALKQLNQQQREYDALKAKIQKDSDLAQQQQGIFKGKMTEAQQMIVIESWQSQWAADPTAFVKQLLADAETWNQKTKESADLEQQINEITAIDGQCEPLQATILALMPSWQWEVVTQANLPFKELPAQYSALHTAIKQKITDENKDQSDLKQLKASIQDFLKSHQDIDGEAALMDLNKRTDIDTLRNMLQEIDNEVLSCDTVLKQKEGNLKNHLEKEEKAEADLTQESLSERKNTLTAERKNLFDQSQELFGQLNRIKINQNRALELKSELEAKSSIFSLWEGLSKALGTTDRDNFRDAAQSYTMRILIDHANVFMKQLSTRYELYCAPNTLAIQVSDLDMGGEKRAASSLSGGETFLVSLALALGLASLNDQGFNIDMLFIDEGFGTLDNESLDMVMTTLENLHALGRKVGLISHVETLKERIPAQIQLIRKDKSTSQVKVMRV